MFPTRTVEALVVIYIVVHDNLVHSPMLASTVPIRTPWGVYFFWAYESRHCYISLTRFYVKLWIQRKTNQWSCLSRDRRRQRSKGTTWLRPPLRATRFWRNLEFGRIAADKLQRLPCKGCCWHNIELCDFGCENSLTAARHCLHVRNTTWSRPGPGAKISDVTQSSKNSTTYRRQHLKKGN